MKKIFKNYKVLFWLFLLVASILLIGPRFGNQGMVVSSKAANSTLQLSAGDVIYTIDGQPATAQLLSQPWYGTIKLSTSAGDKYAQANGTLGLNVKPMPSSNLNFGLDIEGGIRTLLSLNASDNLTVDQTVGTLQTRINLYGLREATIRPVVSESHTFIEIAIAGGTQDEITDLLERQGRFEAVVPLTVRLANGTGELKLSSSHPVSMTSNDSISVDGQDLRVGSNITLEGVVLTLSSLEQNVANISSLAFSSTDIVLVYFDPQHAGMQPKSSGYEWYFQVRLTQEAAQRFATITSGLDRTFDPGAGQSYLSSKLELYLDGELVDSLNIVADLKGKAIQEPAVTGFGKTVEEASKSQKRLQTVLRSGSLPTRVEIISLEVLSPRLGAGFILNIALVLLAAIVVVSVVIAVRYRKIKIIIPMVITAMSEVIIILGASIAIGWTIDMASVAGILAIVGTGIDAQIVLVDQAVRKGEETLSLKERIKRALFIIFGAGGTSIGAMIPLMVLGLGMLRGFALTTIIGVLIGIFVTRPAFGEMVTAVSGSSEG